MPTEWEMGNGQILHSPVIQSLEKYGGNGKTMALAYHLRQSCLQESNALPPTHPPIPIPIPHPHPHPHPNPTNHHHSDSLKGLKGGEEGSGEKSAQKSVEAIFGWFWC